LKLFPDLWSETEHIDSFEYFETSGGSWEAKQRSIINVESNKT